MVVEMELETPQTVDWAFRAAFDATFFCEEHLPRILAGRGDRGFDTVPPARYLLAHGR